MPTYQYRREDGTVFELFQRISDDALTHCPETGLKVERVITGGGGVVYKGSGWYVTDYKSKNNTNAVKKSEKSSNGTGSCCCKPAGEKKSVCSNGSK